MLFGERCQQCVRVACLAETCTYVTCKPLVIWTTRLSRAQLPTHPRTYFQKCNFVFRAQFFPFQTVCSASSEHGLRSSGTSFLSETACRSCRVSVRPPTCSTTAPRRLSSKLLVGHAAIITSSSTPDPSRTRMPFLWSFSSPPSRTARSQVSQPSSSRFTSASACSSESAANSAFESRALPRRAHTSPASLWSSGRPASHERNSLRTRGRTSKSAISSFERNFSRFKRFALPRRSTVFGVPVRVSCPRRRVDPAGFPSDLRLARRQYPKGFPQSFWSAMPQSSPRRLLPTLHGQGCHSYGLFPLLRVGRPARRSRSLPLHVSRVRLRALGRALATVRSSRAASKTCTYVTCKPLVIWTTRLSRAQLPTHPRTYFQKCNFVFRAQFFPFQTVCSASSEHGLRSSGTSFLSETACRSCRVSVRPPTCSTTAPRRLSSKLLVGHAAIITSSSTPDPSRTRMPSLWSFSSPLNRTARSQVSQLSSPHFTSASACSSESAANSAFESCALPRRAHTSPASLWSSGRPASHERNSLRTRGRTSKSAISSFERNFSRFKRFALPRRSTVFGVPVRVSCPRRRVDPAGFPSDLRLARRQYPKGFPQSFWSAMPQSSPRRLLPTLHGQGCHPYGLFPLLRVGRPARRSRSFPLHVSRVRICVLFGERCQQCVRVACLAETCTYVTCKPLVIWTTRLSRAQLPTHPRTYFQKCNFVFRAQFFPFQTVCSASSEHGLRSSGTSFLSETACRSCRVSVRPPTCSTTAPRRLSSKLLVGHAAIIPSSSTPDPSRTRMPSLRSFFLSFQ